MRPGCVAVALVQRQVMVVQSTSPARLPEPAPRLTLTCVAVAPTYDPSEPWLDVHTYSPLGDRVFMPSAPCPYARIAPRDVLAVLPLFSLCDRPTAGVLVLPDVAWDQFLKLSAQTQKKHEKMFAAWASKR